MSQITLMLHKYRNLISLLLLTSMLPCYGAIITTVAGNNTQGYHGDGGLAVTAQLNKPSKITIDQLGNLLIVDTFNSVIRQVNRYGIITTIAGTGTPGYQGDEGRATVAQLNFPGGIAVDSHSGIYVADTRNHVIRKIDPNGIITTFAGTGQSGYSGDYKAAGRAQLNQPTALVLDTKDNLYIADTGNSVIRKINSQGIITTVAGTGQSGMAGDGMLATRALLNRPEGLAVIGRKIYITDTENEVVRVVDETGIIRTLSGTGDPGINSDSTATSLAQFHYPSDIIADSQGNLYIVDSNNFVIRKLDTLTDTISIIAGNRTQGYSGDGRAAIFAQLNMPQGITIDENDNLYISDTYNHTIRKISTRAVDSALIQPRSQTYATRVNQSPVQVDFLVTDVLGNPLTAQTVYFFAPASNTTPKSATTDELGRVSTSVSYGTTGSYQLFAAVSTSYIATQTWIQVQSANPPPPLQPVQPPSVQPSPEVLTIQVSEGDNQQVPVQQAAEAIRFVIKNSKGALIQGQKVTFSVVPDAVLSTQSAVSDDDGVVTTQFKPTETIGKYQIIAYLNDTTAATAQLEVFQPEPSKPEVKPVLPQTLSVSAGDAQIIETGKPSAAIRFSLKDMNNQAMAGKTLSFSMQPQGQGITIPKPITDENGEITIFFNAVNTTGDYLITAQLADSLLTAKTRITVFKPVPVVTAARLVALNLNQVVEVNNKLPVYFTVLDNNGQPLAGQTVLFNLAPNANSLSDLQAVSDSNGQVSTVLNPTNKANDYTLTANVINTAIRATSLIHTFVTDKPEAVELSIRTISGQNQTILWGQNSADIKFQVTTLAGSPVVKRKVLFQLQPSQGELAFTEAITDMEGYVTTRVNSTTLFGDYRVVATISDTDMMATVPLTVIDAHATLKVVGEIQPLGINTASAPIQFIATYRNGQPAANQKVNFTLQPAGHGLSTTQAITDAQGQVTTAMNPTNLEGRYVVTATLDTVRAQAIIQVAALPQTEIIAVTAGAEQHVLLGELSEIITFIVTDGAGQPLAGKRVNFTITPSSDSLITQSALTGADGRVSTRLDKNAKPNSYTITASTERTTISTTVVTHPMVAAVMKQSHTSAITAPDSAKQANLGDTGFFSGVFINNQLQKNIPVSAATKIMVAIKSAHQGKKTNIYITAKKTSAVTRARAAATDSEWSLVQDTEQPQTWQWQPWEGSLDSLQPTESNVYLSESVTQHEYPTEFPSEGEWAITIGYSPPVVDTETPPAVPETLITTAEDTTITVDNMPSLGESIGVDKENNPVPTKSAFSGGISIENASYVREATTLRSRTVQVEGNVKVEPSHVGYLADIIVVIAYKENNGVETFYMMQNPNELIPWNGDKLNLLAFKSAVELPSMYPITLYTGNFPVTGELRFYFGYRLSNNTLIFTQNSINAKVDDEAQMPALGATMEFGKTSTAINSFFVGGVSQDGQTFAATAQLPQSQPVQVTGVINIAPEHVGQRAELLLVAGYTPPGASAPQFFMQDAQNTFRLWQDFNPETLVPKQVIETLEQQVTMILYNGQLPVLGKVDFYFGYRLVANRSVFYPSVPIELVVE